jgi:hypothetical protein
MVAPCPLARRRRSRVAVHHSTLSHREMAVIAIVLGVIGAITGLCARPLRVALR